MVMKKPQNDFLCFGVQSEVLLSHRHVTITIPFDTLPESKEYWQLLKSNNAAVPEYTQVTS